MEQDNSFNPQILGMKWILGNLVLVGSRPLGGKTQFVLGHCIANGTKDHIPVAYFTPTGDRFKTMRILMQMQLGSEVYKNGSFSWKDLKDYPVFVDDTPQMTIDYLINQIFRMVDKHGIQMVIVDTLQDISSSMLDGGTRERQLNAVLRLLKAMAESLGIIIIVTSQLSDYVFQEHRQPTVRDILDVTEADVHCDQIILLYPFNPYRNEYKLILPKGHPFHEKDGGNLVINAIRNIDKHCFEKATFPFEEADDVEVYDMMYQWFEGESEGEWLFTFLDSDGQGWVLLLVPLVEGEKPYYEIHVTSWSGEDILLDDYVELEDVNLIKAVALEKARAHFPDVEINETE